MPVRTADATWRGDLQQGDGTMRLGGGAYEGQYSFTSRFEEGEGTNPEELIGAAHAGCFSMALSGALAGEGHSPEEVSTEARVRIDKEGEGFAIKEVELRTRARVPGISEDEFQRIAEQAKEGCPVSQALRAVDIRLDATLEG